LAVLDGMPGGTRAEVRRERGERKQRQRRCVSGLVCVEMTASKPSLRLFYGNLRTIRIITPKFRVQFGIFFQLGNGSNAHAKLVKIATLDLTPTESIRRDRLTGGNRESAAFPETVTGPPSVTVVRPTLPLI